MTHEWNDPQMVQLSGWTDHPFTKDEYEALCLNLNAQHNVVIRQIVEQDGLMFTVQDNKVNEVDR